MPINEIKKQLFLFIKFRDKKVYLKNLRLWADYHKIPRKEMGYALHLLQEQNAVYYTQKEGWRTN